MSRSVTTSTREHGDDDREIFHHVHPRVRTSPTPQNFTTADKTKLADIALGSPYPYSTTFKNVGDDLAPLAAHASLPTDARSLVSSVPSQHQARSPIRSISLLCSCPRSYSR